MSTQRTFTEEQEQESEHFNAVWNDLVTSKQSLGDVQFDTDLELELDEDTYQIDREEAPASLFTQGDDVFPVPSSRISVVPVMVATVKAKDAIVSRPEMTGEDLFAHRAATVGGLQAAHLQELEQQTTAEYSLLLPLPQQVVEDEESDRSDSSTLATPTPPPVIHKPLAIRPSPVSSKVSPPQPAMRETPSAITPQKTQEQKDILHTAPGTPSEPKSEPKTEDGTASMTPDELFAWRVEKMGILEAIRLLELEQVEQDRIQALHESEPLASAAEFEFFDAAAPVAAVASAPVQETSHFFNKETTPVRIGGEIGDSAFAEEHDNQGMMEYVFGKNKLLVTRGASFNIVAEPTKLPVEPNREVTPLMANEVKTIGSIRTEVEEKELDNLLSARETPTVEFGDSSLVSANVEEINELESDDEVADEFSKTSIWGVSTITLAVGAVAIAGYLAFGRGRRRFGRNLIK
ncbi:UNVERIFIED_CONTAM: hypothetical protein HDU68_007032 [Siphonaria sp. JEL0065]|nr:hypothetical protein HDU68_007032 [Siphonaria sp. JEL0065]